MLPSSAASTPSSASSSAFFWFEHRVAPALRRFGDLPALRAVRESLPWSFIGLVAALPVFFALTHRLAAAELPAFGVMGATLAIVLPYRLAMHLRLSRLTVVAASACAFVLALPAPFTPSDLIGYLRRAGETGLFLAILVSLSVAGGCWAARGRSQAAASALVVAFFALLLFVHSPPANILESALRPLGALGDSYAALLVIAMLETVLWTVGIHGPATLAAIVTPVYLTLQLQNTAAYAHHRPLPHIVVVSLFLFVFPGGAGATLPLAALLLFARARRLRTIARATIVPAIFNINEPLLFGLPIVCNPYLVLPFVAVPLITASTTYAAVARGWVARPAWYIPSAVPSPIAVYLATLDWRAIVLVCANIVIAAAVYAPFARAYDRHETIQR